jgi:hypothetical protein
MMNQLKFAAALLMAMAPLSQVRAQFDAIPDSNAQWRIGHYDGPSFMYDELLYMEADPDTLIDGATFQKLMGYYPGAGIYYAGALRDDGTGKVYYRILTDDESDETVLLYDFDVEVGDTVNVYDMSFYNEGMRPMLVESVDTVQLAGKQRKRISIHFLGPGGAPQFHYWIQGIGGTGGLLTTCGCVTVSGATWLSCMSVNDTIQGSFQNGQVIEDVVPGTCFQMVGIRENAMAQEIVVTPNPSAAHFHLSQASERITVYSAMGQLLFRTHGSTIDLGGYPPGIYTAVISTAQGNGAQHVFVMR